MKRKIVLLGVLFVCLFGGGNLFGDGLRDLLDPKMKE